MMRTMMMMVMMMIMITINNQLQNEHELLESLVLVLLPCSAIGSASRAVYIVFKALRSIIGRKADSIHHHHHHHHPEGVVYRSFCLNSSTSAVSEIVSRRWWCIEYLFPIGEVCTCQRGRPAKMGPGPVKRVLSRTGA